VQGGTKMTKQNEYQKEMKEIAIEIGNCSVCFKEKDNPKFKTCSKCRAYYRAYSRAYFRARYIKK